MFELFKKIVGGKINDNAGESEMVQDTPIALSVLLLEAAHADGECSKAEMTHLIETLTKQYDIPQDEIETLLAESYQKRRDSSDLFKFTRYMNNNLTRDERIQVMESVWRVILVDGHLEAHEDHFAHKLANLMRLTHKDLIDAKLQARQQLK